MEAAVIDQNFPNFHMHKSAGYLVNIQILGLVCINLKFYFSNKIFGDANVAGPWATMSSKGIERFA